MDLLCFRAPMSSNSCYGESLLLKANDARWSTRAGGVSLRKRAGLFSGTNPSLRASVLRTFIRIGRSLQWYMYKLPALDCSFRGHMPKSKKYLTLVHDEATSNDPCILSHMFSWFSSCTTDTTAQSDQLDIMPEQCNSSVDVWHARSSA